MQTKTHSLIESIANVAIGYFVALVSQIIIFAILGIPVQLRDNFIIGLWFTVISIVRSYTLRRIFNRMTDND
jgi:energy-converting hydrogenase Eha subunit A